MSNPAHDVLADLMLASVEADRVEDTYQLLADLVGNRVVREAHEVAFDRLSTAVGAAASPQTATRHTQGKASAERSGRWERPSEASLHLVRRLPDPLEGGRAGRAVG